MTQPQKDELLRARAQTGIRLGNLVLDRVRGAQHAYWEGYKAGYSQAVREDLVRSIPIVVPCRLCGTLVTGDGRNVAFLLWIKNGANGGHPGCPGDRKNASAP